MSIWRAKGEVCINLLIMMYIWLITIFNFYLLTYVMTSFDQIFLSVLAAQVSAILAQLFGGRIYEIFGAPISLSVSYCITATGALAMILYGLQHQDTLIFLFVVLFMRFGISCAYNIAYACHQASFPSLYQTDSLGYCTFAARLFTSFSPLLATMSQKISMIFIAVTSFIGMIIVFGLRQINNQSAYQHQFGNFAKNKNN